MDEATQEEVTEAIREIEEEDAESDDLIIADG